MAEPSKNFQRLLAAIQGTPGQFVKPGSPGHAALLETGYGMDLERAKEIVAAREKDPNAYPYEVYKQAKAMIAAHAAKPVAVARKEGWKRDTQHKFFGEAK